MIRKSIVILCISLLWFLNSCSRLPPGNPYYSLTLMTADKLNSLTEFAPVDLDEYDNSPDSICETLFIPDRSSFVTGFIVQRNGSSFRFWYRNSAGTLSNYQEDSVSINEGEEPQYLAETIPGYTAALFFLKFDNMGSHLRILQSTTDISTGTESLVFNEATGDDLGIRIYWNFNASHFSLSGSGNINVKNAYFSPVNNKLYFLFQDTGDSRYYECNYNLNNTWLISPATTRGNSTYISLSLLGNRINYFYDVTKSISVISLPDFNESNAFYWDSALTPAEIPNQTSGIQHLLSSSLITSVADNKMMIYDYQGTAMNTVYMGGITFLYEQKDATANYQMYFSRCSTVNYDKNRIYYFSLYSYPTANFTGL